LIGDVVRKNSTATKLPSNEAFWASVQEQTAEKPTCATTNAKQLLSDEPHGAKQLTDKPSMQPLVAEQPSDQSTDISYTPILTKKQQAMVSYRTKPLLPENLLPANQSPAKPTVLATPGPDAPPETKSLATSLLREGFHAASRILIQHDQRRRLPSRPLDSFLVVSEDRAEIFLGPPKSTTQSIGGVAKKDFRTLSGSSKSASEPIDDAARKGPSVSALSAHALLSAPSSRHPAQVKTVKSIKHKETLTAILGSRHKEKKLTHLSSGAERSFCALQTQNPTTFALDGVMSVHMLPGEAPVIDHAIAALSTEPDWGKVLTTLKAFAKLRITNPSEERLPEIRELVVGESTDEDFREAGKWLARKHKATKAKYGFCLPALDVECLRIRLATGCNLPDLEFEMLSNDDGKVVVPIAMPGDKGNILKLPVLLMYGGVRW
jgi:hypothetical protein